MNTKFKYLLLLIPLCFIFKAGFATDPIRFKIQATTSAEKLPKSQITKIDSLSTYVLPSGSKLYFSGGFYQELNKADSALLVVKQLGFKKACIRVFKGSVLLGRVEGESYLLSLRLKDDAFNKQVLKETNLKKDTIVTEKKEIVKEAPEVSDVPEESEKDTTESALEDHEDIKEQFGDNVVLVDEQPDSVERAAGSTSIVVNSSFIPNPPIYSIHIVNTPNNSSYPEVCSSITDEIIYVFNQNGRRYYLVGKYKNQEAAFAALQKYKTLTPNAEVVGQYRERVISLEVANKLYHRFHNFPQRY